MHHPSAVDIQHHLYQSFLGKQTTDTCLQVRARGWAVEYRLHRVVLIQAGFFRSLFTTGFRESSNRKLASSDGDSIPVQFDDPNITRPAFEFCLARLYGGGPEIYVSPVLKPSLSQPLTPFFLTSPPVSPPPPNHHPATPRFLLSLIATSLYLSIPSVTSDALSLVLSTIGPHTVIQYLSFAIGKGIGDHSAEDFPSLVSLEDVGRIIPNLSGIDENAGSSSTSSLRVTTKLTMPSTRDETDCAPRKLSGHCDTSDSDSGSSVDLERISADFRTNLTTEPGEFESDGGLEFLYGTASNKIGETCACWLARWGKDILPYEEDYSGRLSLSTNSAPAPAGPVALLQSQVRDRSSSHPPPISPFTSSPSDSRLGGSGGGRRATLSSPISTPLPSAPSLDQYAASATVFKPLSSTQRPPAIWSRSGLTPKWVRGIISSDDFFLPGGEMDRYTFATRVVELRRREGILSLEADQKRDIAGEDGDSATKRAAWEDDKEEKEWAVLFRTGFYYSHMSMDDLLYIQHDLSPSTKKPYVPLSTLKSAHWSQSLFRMTVMSRPSLPGTTNPIPISNIAIPASPPASSSPPAPSPITVSRYASDHPITTSDILAARSHRETEGPDGETDYAYFPVLSDGSQRLGNDLQMNQPASPTSDPTLLAPSFTFTPGGKRAADEQNFFGIANGRRTAEEAIRDDPTGNAQWTTDEPCRFSVEFWNVESLKPSHRLYSQTVWCMGSLWNVYVQIVRKKGFQLGVYLQRQSFVEALPPHSIPASSSDFTLHHSSSVPTFHPNSGSRSPTPRPPTPNSGGNSTRGRPWVIPHATTGIPFTRSPSLGTSSMSSEVRALSSTSGVPSPTMPNTAPSIVPSSPYRDPRQVIKAFFSITCPSATGTSATKFRSAPDMFSVTQSWGWKSSKAEEWVDLGATPIIGSVDSDVSNAGHTHQQKSECSLRATILLGVV